MAKKLARILVGGVAVWVACLWAEQAEAGEYRGTPFSAEAWDGTDQTLELRYKLYVGSAGYRLEATRSVQGPDIIIAQFAAAQFIYVDIDTGAVNFLPMGEDDWGRFHGIACADFEYRKRIGDGDVAGRPTEIWQCIGSRRYKPDTKIWWDSSLGYQIRSDELGYITELRNIVTGEPDPALFQPPGTDN